MIFMYNFAFIYIYIMKLYKCIFYRYFVRFWSGIFLHEEGTFRAMRLMNEEKYAKKMVIDLKKIIFKFNSSL